MGVIFSFRPSNSFLHNCPAIIKFFALFILAFLPWYITLPLYVIIAIVIKTPIKNYLKSSIFFGIIAIFILFSTGWNDMLYFISIILSGILFADTTNPEDLARQLEPIIGKTLSIAILLTLAMLPIVFETCNQVKLAYKAREKKHIDLMYLETILSILLDKNEEMAIAYKNRGLE